MAHDFGAGPFDYGFVVKDEANIERAVQNGVNLALRIPIGLHLFACCGKRPSRFVFKTIRLRQHLIRQALDVLKLQNAVL
ncbi:MAG: hypothetical protein D6823_13820 [Chloroflexi bacterium]|nr:MAG: hypothetical protein D6823_13820 [Chloroflexota bacterium]